MIAGFKSILIKFVIFALVALAMLFLLYNTMINGVPGDTRTYSADFSSTSGLSSGDDIRVAGVRVGKVKSISLKDNHAVVQMEISKDQPVLDNTQVLMRYANLIGQRYLSLVQPNGPDGKPKLGADQSADKVIPSTRTDPGFDLTALLDGFRPLLQVLQPADVNRLAESIIQVLQGEGGSIDQLLQQTTQLTTFVANRDQIINQVLNNLTPVLNDISGQGTQLSTTVKQLNALMTGLAADRQSIGTSISSLSTLIASTSDLLNQARTPVTVDTKLFRQIVETTNANKALLTQGLNAFGSVFGTLGKISSYTNGVNIYLCSLTIDLGVSKMNLSGNPNGGPWTAVCQ